MKKRIISTLITGSMLLSFAACNQKTNEVVITTFDESQVSNVVVDAQDIQDVSFGDVTGAKPAIQGTRLYPIYSYINYDVYTYDPGYSEKGSYKMGLVDENGNIVYEPEYSYIEYFEENDCYIAAVFGEFGLEKCCLISADGSFFSGEDYNGYYVDEEGNAFLSYYKKGNMSVTCLDKDLNVVFENKVIKVSEDVAGVFYKDKGICCVRMFEDTAMITSTTGKFQHPDVVLVDIATGESLACTFYEFGDFLIDIGNMNVTVYDKNGNVYLEGYKRYIYFKNESLILYNDTEAVAFDKNGNIVNRIALKNGYSILDSDNFVVINNDYETYIYDKELNQLTKCQDVHLSSGGLFEIVKGDENSIVFLSVTGGFIENIINGNKISFSTEEGDLRIFNGTLYLDFNRYDTSDNDLNKYYDAELNEIDVDYLLGCYSEDIITGKIYVSSYDEDSQITKIVDADTGDEICEFEGELYDYFMVCDGNVCGLVVKRPNEYKSVLFNITDNKVTYFKVSNG